MKYSNKDYAELKSRCDEVLTQLATNNDVPTVGSYLAELRLASYKTHAGFFPGREADVRFLWDIFWKVSDGSKYRIPEAYNAMHVQTAMKKIINELTHPTKLFSTI